MDPIEVLKREHRLIERVVAALETAARRLESGEPIPPDFFVRAVDFIRGYADGVHHQKEEGVLFPAMRAAGIPSAGGPVSVMLDEHVQARSLTAAMRAAAERLRNGEAGARDEVARNALAYAALLRDHIAKEDQAFFPMANDAIRGPAMTEVAASFERLEREETAQRLQERYLGLAESLERDAIR